MVEDHRTWLEIDLDKLIANYQTACRMTNAKVTCVVKSNAYGHGIVQVSDALQHAGCRSFAVSCAREALLLRNNGITGEILHMGYPETECVSLCIQNGITMTVSDFESLELICEKAQRQKKQAVIHIKADTGFHRLGFSCDEDSAKRLVQRLQEFVEYVKPEGLYSHLGLINAERDLMQYRQLLAFEQYLEAYGLEIKEKHICDSIGLVRYPDWHMDRVRVGAFLYGVRPSRSDHLPFADEETLIFKTTVSQLRYVPSGEPVGYSDDMVLDHDATIATLPVGYGDGYPRSLSYGKGHVLINGSKAHVVGLVCMDQMMVDVTMIPDCRKGDTAILLGGGIGYGQYAEWAHTNRNECLAILSQRPVRYYYRNGSVIQIVDSMMGCTECEK